MTVRERPCPWRAFLPPPVRIAPSPGNIPMTNTEGASLHSDCPFARGHSPGRLLFQPISGPIRCRLFRFSLPRIFLARFGVVAGNLVRVEGLFVVADPQGFHLSMEMAALEADLGRGE